MVSLERTLKMTVEQLLQFFPMYRNLRDIEVGLICKLHNDAQPLSYTILLEEVLAEKKCPQKHGGFSPEMTPD